MRRKKNLIPRMERAGAYLVSAPEQNRGRWREQLGLLPDARLWLELGCGKGSFAVKTALCEGDGFFLLALDRVREALVVGMENAMEQSLSNLLFIDGDAELLPALFAPGEIDGIYINFCDPWPAERHAKRRLTHERFLKSCALVLRPGGEILFKTDNPGLFTFSLDEFPKAGFDLRAVTGDLHAYPGPELSAAAAVTTDYEDKFIALGLPIRCARAILAEKPFQEE